MKLTCGLNIKAISIALSLLTIILPIMAQKYHSMRLMMPAAISVTALALTLAGVFPLNLLSDDDIGPFGIGSCHINNRSTEDYARWVPQMKAIGLKYYRSCQANWDGLEPVEGQWKRDVLDELMVYMTERNFAFGGTLIGNPEWNTKDKRGNMPVNNLQGL